MVSTLTGVTELVGETMDKQIMVWGKKKAGYRTRAQWELSVEAALLDIPDWVSFFMMCPLLNTAVWLIVDYFLLI